MTNLKAAHDELFRRTPDECFATLADLKQHCRAQKEASQDRWQLPQTIIPTAGDDQLSVQVGNDGAFLLNDWSFGQFCGLAGVSKETVNRLSPATATSVFRETLPIGKKPLQLLTTENMVRSIHGVSYTRLWNVHLLNTVQECASDFQPPQKAATGGTGLYAGEQDMFCFMVDPTGWVEIGGEAFAPGFFVWNSEVGKRSIGISTFWWQAVCANHIVWDAIDVTEVSRKHTANVHDALTQIQQSLTRLVQLRDQRRDGFFRVMQKALETTLGSNAEDAMKELTKSGIKASLAKEALKIAEQKGGFTIFALVDALTRITGRLAYAGERIEADRQAAGLLALAQ